MSSNDPISPEEMALILGRFEAMIGRLDLVAEGLLTAADALNPLPGQTPDTPKGPILQAAYLHAAQCAAARPSLQEDAAAWVEENCDRCEELLGKDGFTGPELLAAINHGHPSE